MGYVIPTTDGGFFVENGIVWQDERGRTMLVARFDSDQKAEQYLRKKMTEPKTKKRSKKTSGKYEQKKRKHHA